MPQSMEPNTVLLLELNPTRINSSKSGANLWVAEATNKSTGYHTGVQTVSDEVDTKPLFAYYQPGGGPSLHLVDNR